MVDMQSCKVCKGLFAGSKSGICPKCKQEEHEALVAVTDSLRDNPGQSIEELSENTGVEEDMILRFIREGRIASDLVIGEVSCGRCGKPAQSLAVRLCPKCLGELQRASAGMMNKPPPISEKSEDDSPRKPATGVSTQADDDDSRKVHETIRTKRK